MNHQDDQKLLCWEIPTTSESPLHVSLELGNPFFIIGANGSGKSALVHHFVLTHQDLEPKPRWLSAHRQTWLDSASVDITAQSRRNLEANTLQQDIRPEARRQDTYAAQKQHAVLYDLVEADNDFNRKMVEEFRESEDIQKLEDIQKDIQKAKKGEAKSLSVRASQPASAERGIRRKDHISRESCRRSRIAGHTYRVFGYL